jgi:hypothetical protein
MRKRLVRAVIFIAVAIGLAVGGASAAGAMDGIHFGGAPTSDSNSWT